MRRRNVKEQLLEALIQTGLKQGDFTLTSGRKSDYLVDCKPAMLTALGHMLVGNVLCDELMPLNDQHPIDGVAGVTVGGCSLASSVAIISNFRSLGPNRQGWDALYVRKTAKEHGSGNQIEGTVGGKRRVVLLEDVGTTGGSAGAAVEALRKAGYVVEDVVVLVNREEGAREALAAQGVRLTALFTRRDFFPSEATTT